MHMHMHMHMHTRVQVVCVLTYAHIHAATMPSCMHVGRYACKLASSQQANANKCVCGSEY
jgi:hypothetical protein